MPQSKTTFVGPAEEQSENDQADTEIEKTVDAEGEGGEQVQDQVDAPADAEKQARRLGWHPKDEYEKSGRDPSKWVSAEDFIRRSETEVPILRENNRKLDRKVTNLEKKLDEGNKLLRDLVASQKVERDKAVTKAIADLKAQRAEAASNGDTARVEAISDEIEGQKAELAKPVAAERQSQDQDRPEVPQEVIEWAEANPWFNDDPVMNAAATAHFGLLMRDKTLSDTQRLAKVKTEIVKRFPDKFTNPNRSRPAAVESGNGGGRRSSAKSWNDLPRDAQDIADRLIRQGAVKDRNAYIKDYPW